MKIHSRTSETICPLPFLHTYITANGSLVGCCEAQEDILSPSKNQFQDMWNSNPYKSLRKALINGEKPMACKKCWANEELGVYSNRQEMWGDFTTGMFGDHDLTVNDDYSINQLPTAIEMKCSNLCNLKCRMCHPESSHRIQEDKEIISRYRKNISWSSKILSSQNTVSNLTSLDKSFFDKLSVVQYSGGEPLISDEQLDFTKDLLKHNPENINLRYATNLTQLNYRNTYYPEIWKNFKNVNIKISIDGLDDVYNYIRVGSHFNKVVDNIKKLQDSQITNMQISIGFTSQAYNIFQIPEFLNYFEKIVPRKAITTHLLHSPRMMMINVFPEKIKEKLIKKLTSSRDDIESIVSTLSSTTQPSKYWESLCQYTKEMEDKYSIEQGFQYILDKYLADF